MPTLPMLRPSLLLATGLFCAGAHAQHCGTRPPTEREFEHTRDVVAHLDVEAFRNAGTTCVPLQAHVVRQAGGTGGVTLADLNVAISFLNDMYHPAGIEFYWRAMPNFVNNADYYTYNEASPDNDTETALAALFTTATNAVNIYFVNSIVLSSGFEAAGYAYYPANSVQSNRIVMAHAYTANTPVGTFSHEFGHYFNLYHTHNGTENGNTAANAERVVRTGANANCSTAGDLLCDTQADPRYNSAQFNGSTCTYTGGGTDNLGVPYTPPVDNIMSYYPDQCTDLFTAQQYTRVAQGLLTRLGHSAYSLTAPPMNVAAASGLTATWGGGNTVALQWTDNASNEMGYLVERSTTSATSGFRAISFGATAPNATTWTDNALVSNSTTWYRIKASNGDCNTYSNVATVNVGLAYCTPTYYQTCAGGTDVIIDRFALTGTGSSINNSDSNCSPNGFGNFTTQSCTLTAGTAHAITINAMVGAGSYYETMAQVWIDLNRDGDFEDAGEKMLPTAGNMAPTFTSTITVPLTALNGASRLRVRCWDAFNGCDPDACSYCAFGETEEYTVVIQGGASVQTPMLVRTFLSGAFDATTGLMTDSLRRKGLVPLTEPYTALGYTFVGGGGETTSASTLQDQVATTNDVVDWVIVEARDPSTPAIVLRSQAGLLWRNGLITTPHGSTPFVMGLPFGTYHLVVKHRNHLGVMTGTPLQFGALPALVDFSSSSTVTYGTDARKQVGGTMVLWSGDVTFNGQVMYNGAGNDRDPILTTIGGTVPTATLTQYRSADVNMDGRVKYLGTANDRDIILGNIGGTQPTQVRQAQLP